MDNLALLGVAIALGMDAFAVALAVSSGLVNVTFRHIFRLTWHFGLFQSLMTFIGWLGGVAIYQCVLGTERLDSLWTIDIHRTENV